YDFTPPSIILRVAITNMTPSDLVFLYSLLPTCQQPLDTGPCHENFPRFYYDSNMCRKFIYSGCGGNGNNFEYYYQCVLKCQQFGKDN
uniref:BPTI/Kunitz inhibitor domain-containing protein n=1 Tax=Podarcis muralis TaxID=64176 RepID=A0A670KC73_PODMU